MMVMGQLGLAAWSTITCPDIGDEVGVLDHGGPWSQSNCDYPTLGREHAVKRDFDPLRPWWSATAVAVLSIATVVGARRIYRAFTRRPRLPKDEDPLPALR